MILVDCIDSLAFFTEILPRKPSLITGEEKLKTVEIKMKRRIGK